jgi:hypothetical protein
MFSLLSKLSRSRNSVSNDRTIPSKRIAARVAAVEALEDRRLHSVSPGGEVSSFSWGVSQTGGLKAGSSEVLMETVMSFREPA